MLNTDFGDQYTVQGEIARSSKAWIYRGTHVASGREVAIKVLRPCSMPGQRLEARFAREFQVLKSLNHPNIVQVYDAALTSNGLLFFAMELVNGQTLSNIVAKEGPLNLARAAAILDQVALAIDRAHASHIIHRDINPSNILVAQQPGGQEVAKVLDFGLAKVLETANEADGNNAGSGLDSMVGHPAVLTQAGAVLGTPEYMSPEQAKGIGTSPQSDVYSLGVTLFAILEGRPPYERRSEFETIVAHVTQPIPSFKNPGLVGLDAIEGVVHKALAKNPEERFESAGEFARAFRKAVQDLAKVRNLQSAGFRSVIAPSGLSSSSSDALAKPKPNPSSSSSGIKASVNSSPVVPKNLLEPRSNLNMWASPKMNAAKPPASTSPAVPENNNSRQPSSFHQVVRLPDELVQAAKAKITKPENPPQTRRSSGHWVLFLLVLSWIAIFGAGIYLFML